MQNTRKVAKTMFIVVVVLVVLAGVLGLTVHLMRGHGSEPSEPIPSSCSVELTGFEFGHTGSGSYQLVSVKETDALIKQSIDKYGYFDVNVKLDIDTDEALQWGLSFNNLEVVMPDEEIMDVIVDESDSTKAVVRVKDLSNFGAGTSSSFYICVYNSDRSRESDISFGLFELSTFTFFGDYSIFSSESVTYSKFVELTNFEFGVIGDSISPRLVNDKETYAKIVEAIASKGYFDIPVQLDCDTDEVLAWECAFTGSTPSGLISDYFEVMVDAEDSRKAVIRIKNLDIFGGSYNPVVEVSNSNATTNIYIQVLDFGDMVFFI